MKKRSSEKESRILYEFQAYGRKDKIVKEYWNTVNSVIQNALIFHKILYSEEDIEDLRNEVFYQLFVNECRRLKQFNAKKGTSLTKWIKLIANQTVLNEIRKNGLLELSKQECRIPMGEIEEDLVGDDEDRFNAREELRLIRDTMKRRSHKDQAVLKQLYYDWLPLKEVASSINKTESAARAIIFRAKKRLRDLMEERMDLKLRGHNRGGSSVSPPRAPMNK